MSVSTRWIAAVGAGLLCIALVTGWVLSAPRSAFPAHSDAVPDTGNAEYGRMIFAAGDCASCHASPGQSDPLRLGGGLALASPYGTFQGAQYLPGSGGRHWQLELDRPGQCAAQRRVAGRQALLPCVSLPELRTHEARGYSGLDGISPEPAPSLGTCAAPRAGSPVSDSAGRRIMEAPVLRSKLPSQTTLRTTRGGTAAATWWSPWRTALNAIQHAMSLVPSSRPPGMPERSIPRT